MNHLEGGGLLAISSLNLKNVAKKKKMIFIHYNQFLANSLPGQ